MLRVFLMDSFFLVLFYRNLFLSSLEPVFFGIGISIFSVSVYFIFFSFHRRQLHSRLASAAVPAGGVASGWEMVKLTKPSALHARPAWLCA
ncbi:hypothetical protein DSUL_50178 [Desulfovibrionales bacterium]